VTTNGTGKPTGRPPAPSGVLMVPGLSIWKGTVSEEYLTDLKPWKKAYKVFQEMEDDAVIGTLYESIKTPLLDAKFVIEPASPEEADVAAADWLRSNTIDNPNFDWLDHVDDMLDALAYGFALSEIVLGKTDSGLLDLVDLLPIGQDTLARWGDLDKHGRPTSFVQLVMTENRIPTEREAPIEKLLHFAFRPRKRNPMGRAISRALYRPWYFKKNLEVVEAIGAERDVGNVPVAKLGEGFITDDDETRLRDALQGLRMDETAYLIVPNGVEVSPFGSGGKVYDIRGIIRDYAHIIRQRFFMDFVSMGSEGVGTQALAKEVTGFFSLALGSVQRELLAVWNRQLVPYMFKWNQMSFGELEELPKVRWNKPGKINVQSLAQSVSTLVGGEIVHWNKELEDHLREQFELPAITEEEIAAQEQHQMDLQSQMMPPPANNANGEAQKGASEGKKESISESMS
tara:strand:- start:2929 stop:4299 length:1371 start_codon:yes stop_codon:yes gene_type:complete